MIDIGDIKAGRLTDNQRYLVDLFESENGDKYILQKYVKGAKSLMIYCGETVLFVYYLESAMLYKAVNSLIDDYDLVFFFEMYELPLYDVSVFGATGKNYGNSKYEKGTIITLFRKYLEDYNNG